MVLTWLVVQISAILLIGNLEFSGDEASILDNPEVQPSPHLQRLICR